MATITQFPRGLVSLTGLRDMGEAPRELAAVIAPSIDVTQFLLLNRETVVVAGTATAIGFVQGPEVPAGELWYLHSFTTYCVPLIAGEKIRFTCGVLYQGGFTALGPHSANPTSGERASATCFQSSWIGPGAKLAAFVEAYTSAGGIGLNLETTISRLRI